MANNSTDTDDSSVTADFPVITPPLASTTPGTRIVYITFINTGHDEVTVSWEVEGTHTTIRVKRGGEEYFGFEARKEYEMSFQKKAYRPYVET
jgi:hypothetical protein